MKLFPILFLLAVAAGEALDEICNSRKTPTNLIARRTWPSQIASTTAKLTTNTTTASPKSTTTAVSSTVSTTAPTTTTTTAGTSTTSIPLTTTTKSSSTMSSTSTTMATTTPLRPIFTCAVDNPACGNMCGDATSATTGVVQSPNFPGDYGNYYRRFCEITIIAPAGWMIQLNFTTFNVETDAAYVQIGGKMSITGNEIPALVPVAFETMSIGFLYAASSKPSTAIYNWQATLSVTSDRSSCSVSNPASACKSMCTNATSAGTGVVQSPNFPGDYGKTYYGCSATIIVPIGKKIQLTFTTFNLETSAAILFVTDKNTVYLNSVSGSTAPAAVTTSSNVMYMSFTSYGSTKPSNAIYNWQATYTAV